jgi:flagellar assembly protein FliH
MAILIESARLEGEPLVLSYRQVLVPASAQAPHAPDEPPAIEETETTLAELRKQAFEDGYRDGHASGSAEAQAELAQGADRLLQLAQSIREALQLGIEGQEDAAVEIAFAAACKVIGEFAATEQGLRAAVREAMRGVRAREGVVLKISPQDFALLSGREEGLRELADEHRVEVLADDRVAAGGCMLETAGGTLDARLDVQLRQLAAVLAGARNQQAE